MTTNPAVSTEIALCNLALSHLGITQKITSLDPATDPSAEAEQCALLYPAARDAVLAAHEWSFATTTATLTLEEVETHPGWSYLYVCPADLLRVLRVGSGAIADRGELFAIVHVNGKVFIATEAEGAAAEYIAQVTDVKLFSPAFVAALSWRMAGDLAPALSHSANQMQGALQMYMALLGQAKQLDAVEGYAQAPTSTRYKGAR
jgi:hypothetical protein